MSEGAHPIVPGRSCGQCSLCCKLLAVTELDKPANKWCAHCWPGQGGCGIYQTRPDICKTYACGWLMSEAVAEEWYPLKCHMILTLAPLDGILTCTVSVDGRHPDIWREPPYYGQLKRMARTGLRVKRPEDILLVCVRCNGRVWLLMEDDDVDISQQFYVVKFVGSGEPATIELYRTQGEAQARVAALTLH